MAGGYSLHDYILAINTVAGIWSVAAGVALFVLPWLAFGGDVFT